MTQTAVYYDSTGEIVDIYSWDDDATTTDFDTLTPDGGGYALDDEAAPDKHYYVAGVRTDRPVIADDKYIINGDGIESVTLALPVGTVVTPDFYLFSAATSAAENFVFTSTLRGVFSFGIDAPFPYVDQVVRIIVNDDDV